jgi:hypothetical protein
MFYSISFSNKYGGISYKLLCFKIHTSEATNDHLQGTLNYGYPSCNLHDGPEQHTMPGEQMSQVDNISHLIKLHSSPENIFCEGSLVKKKLLKRK